MRVTCDDAFQASSCQIIGLQAAKATVVNGNFAYDFASTDATELDFTEDGFYSDFSKMLGFFYGDIVGLEAASGFRSDQRVGDRRSFQQRSRSLHQHQQLLRQQQGRMVTSQPTSLPRLRPRPPASKPGSRQWMKNKASMSLSKSLIIAVRAI